MIGVPPPPGGPGVDSHLTDPSLLPPAARLVLSGDPTAEPFLGPQLQQTPTCLWALGPAKKKQSGKVCRDLWWWEGCRVLIPGELSAQLGGKYGNQAKGAELGKEMPLSSNLGGSWSRAKSCLCSGGCVGPTVWPTPSGGMGKGLGYLCWAGREISQRISCGLRGCGTWLLGMGG